MNIKTNISNLFDVEKSILIGSLLGDGTLQKRGINSFRFRIAHGKDQEDYVAWKYMKLQRLCQTTQPPKLKINNKDLTTVEFYTSSGEYLKEFFDLFYKPSTNNSNGEVQWLKKITSELLEKYPLDSIILSVWFMDDGSVRNDCYSGKLATQCFSLDEQHLLRDYLAQSGINCNIVKHTEKSGQYYLSIPSKSFSKLVEIIEPTVKEIPCMRYKLNEKRNPYKKE